MNQSISTLYKRYRNLSLLIVTGLMMLLSFLWYLPGAYHARTMDDYHVYSWRALKFTNVLDIYVLHNLDKHDTPGFILGGIGIDYPTLLSLLIRATASIGVSDPVTTEIYRSSTPPSNAPPQDVSTPIGIGNDAQAGPAAANNVPAYLLANYAVVFVFGLLAILLMARWPGSQPWMFAASPVLLLYAGYNWDLVSFALTLAGFLLLKRSTERPDPGRSYNLFLEICGFAVLAVAVWFKLFPIVFLGAALIDRARRGMWRAGGMGLGVFAAITLIINVPLMLINYTSWYFYIWFNSNRPVEPSSIWYLIFGGMDLGFTIRPDTTIAINILSLLFVVGGGLVAAVMAWRSPRRDIMMPLGCFLLLWWFTFNKLYDPNFDLSLLFILAVMGAPMWLNSSLIPLSLTWYLTAICGLGLLTFGASPEMNAWYVSHVLMFMIVIRLAFMFAMIAWLGRKLMTNDEPVEEPQVSRAVISDVDGRKMEMAPALRQ
jgi:hypothetical protein